MTQFFTPPLGLKNTDVQNIFASAGPRKWLTRWRAREFLQASEGHIVDCGQGVRLSLEYNPGDSRLVILLHGWEGHCRSVYMLACAMALAKQGFSVARLNFRDHGDTQHLNRDLFNSTRVQEVAGAMRAIKEKWQAEKLFVAGFSLGGNFALRLASLPNGQCPTFQHCIAVCPPVDPADTSRRIVEGRRFYHRYFVKNWKASLQQKNVHYPELGLGKLMDCADDLDTMNQIFIPRYTHYDTVTDYFSAYNIGGDKLRGLRCPSTIITSEDDPIIGIDTFQAINRPQQLELITTPFGGHCAFIDSWTMSSWADQKITEIFAQS